MYSPRVLVLLCPVTVPCDRDLVFVVIFVASFTILS